MIAITMIEQSIVEDRARQSLGTSDDAIYSMVARTLDKHSIEGGLIVDIGCGAGKLLRFVRERFTNYIGVDVIRFDGFPENATFLQVNLDSSSAPLPDESADVVVAVETIEHLENPRAFMRELVRIMKPGGHVVVTTPNQLSLLSLMTLIVKRQFQAFQATDYPAHLTALLEIDLFRISSECGLVDIGFDYSMQGRLVWTSKHYPTALSKLFPRALSDNLLMIARKPDE